MYWLAIIITAVLLAAYCLLILIYRQWFIRLRTFSINKEAIPETSFTVIIPARNESQNIGACLQAVLNLQYPTHLYEVIVVNDHSTDDTEQIIRTFQLQHSNLQLINLSEYLQGDQINAYKKKAIELAISHSKGDWIVTTDADCLMQPDWLTAYDAYIKHKNPVFIAAPVMFVSQPGFLSKFQLLDFMSLQGITAASVSAGFHTMCNGANIAYRKDVFEEVGKFSGIDKLASGDDMLLMNKIKKRHPDKMGYLFCKPALVLTAPMQNWKSFLNQRIRWASKAESYQDRSIFWILLLVYLVNALLLVLLLVSPFIENGINNWLILMIAKTGIELSFMLPVSRFYGLSGELVWFPLMQPFHILYTVLAGWLGKFGTYQWKGREVQ